MVSILGIIRRARAPARRDPGTDNDLLRQIVGAVAAREDLDSVFLRVVRYLENTLAESASIWLREGDRFAVRAVGDRTGQVWAGAASSGEMTIPAEAPVLQELGRGELICFSRPGLPDVPALDEIARSLDLGSLVVAPLMENGTVGGVLIIGKSRRNGFGCHETDFLEGVGKHVAVAVQQAQLHRELRSAYDAVRQAEQAQIYQERLRALEETASELAHDIINTICAIPLYTAVIEQEVALSDRATKQLRIIETAVDEVQKTVGCLRQCYRQGQREPPGGGGDPETKDRTGHGDPWDRDTS